MVNVLAHGMLEQKSVFWATKNYELVKKQMSQLDLSAADAAKAWALNPTLANQNAAAEAAAKADFQGLGTCAAQGAAWAKLAGATSTPTIPGLSPETMELMNMAGKDANTGNTVAGSVKLAAAMKDDPAFMKTFSAGEYQTPSLSAAPSLEAPSMSAAPPEPSPMTPEQTQKNFSVLAPFIAIGMAAAKQIDWHKI